jgi:hypothetical protein
VSSLSISFDELTCTVTTHHLVQTTCQSYKMSLKEDTRKSKSSERLLPSLSRSSSRTISLLSPHQLLEPARLFEPDVRGRTQSDINGPSSRESSNYVSNETWPTSSPYPSPQRPPSHLPRPIPMTIMTGNRKGPVDNIHLTREKDRRIVLPRMRR